MRRWFLGVALTLTVVLGGPGSVSSLAQPGGSTSGSVPKPEPAVYARVAKDVEFALKRHVIFAWFPKCVDNVNGGFHSNFNDEWKPERSDGKFGVFQARMTWVASKVAHHRPPLKTAYTRFANHGLKFLNDVLWDKQHGGFLWGVDDAGKITPRYGDVKNLYGQAFGVYGAAAAYEATGDRQALDLARRAFLWIDKHHRDPVHGGYFESVTRQGQRYNKDDKAPQVATGFFAEPSRKWMNSHIHLLEAYTDLYRVWKDDLLRKRLEELLHLVRDSYFDDRGFFHHWLNEDLSPVPGDESYGHNLETAFLLIEASDVLGQREPRTMEVARKTVDHTLSVGWDPQTGKVFEEGSIDGTKINKHTSWWSQVEAVNALALMHEIYGHETDAYWQAFHKTWDFFNTRFIDQRNKGVWGHNDDRGRPGGDKAQIWKAAYHDGRALMFVADRLNRMADQAKAGTAEADDTGFGEDVPAPMFLKRPAAAEPAAP